jgi:hypothetical protein
LQESGPSDWFYIVSALNTEKVIEDFSICFPAELPNNGFCDRVKNAFWMSNLPLDKKKLRFGFIRPTERTLKW